MIYECVDLNIYPHCLITWHKHINIYPNKRALDYVDLYICSLYFCCFCSQLVWNFDLNFFSIGYQVDDTEVISFLLSTEIIPLCLRTMEMGSELSKTVECSCCTSFCFFQINLCWLCLFSLFMPCLVIFCLNAWDAEPCLREPKSYAINHHHLYAFKKMQIRSINHNEVDCLNA
jgi:hypothetical protein